MQNPNTKRLLVKSAWFLFYPLLLLAWPLVWTEFDAFERHWKERHNDSDDN